MNNLFQFMYYFKSKMVPLLQLRYFRTIFLYYFKEKKLLIKPNWKKEKERQMERGRRRKGEVKGVLVSEYTSVLLQMDERW